MYKLYLLFYLKFIRDNIMPGNILKHVSTFNFDWIVFLNRVKDPQRFRVPEFDENNKIKRIEEKPKETKSNYAVTGISIRQYSI